MAISVFSSKQIHGHEPQSKSIPGLPSRQHTLAADHQSDGDSTTSSYGGGSRKHSRQTFGSVSGSAHRSSKRSSAFQSVSSPNKQYMERKLKSTCHPSQMQMSRHRGQNNSLSAALLADDDDLAKKSSTRLPRPSLLCRCKSDGAASAGTEADNEESVGDSEPSDEASVIEFDAATRAIIDDWSETWSSTLYDTHLSPDLWFRSPLDPPIQPKQSTAAAPAADVERLATETDCRFALCILQKLMRIAMSETLTTTQASSVICLGRKLFPSIGINCTRTTPSKTTMLVDTVVRQTMRELGSELAASSMLWPAADGAASKRSRAQSARPNRSATDSVCTELTKYIVMNALDIALTCAGRGMMKTPRVHRSVSQQLQQVRAGGPSSQLAAGGSMSAWAVTGCKNVAKASDRLSSVVGRFVDQLTKDVHDNLAAMSRKPSAAMLETVNAFSDEIAALYNAPSRRQQRPGRVQSAACNRPRSAAPSRPADVEETDAFAEILMNLTLHDRLEDLRNNFVDGQEMVELATRILRSYCTMSKSGQLQEQADGTPPGAGVQLGREQLAAHLVSQLIALTLNKLKAALDSDRISPEDLVAMVVAIDSGTFASELRKNRNKIVAAQRQQQQQKVAGAVTSQTDDVATRMAAGEASRGAQMQRILNESRSNAVVDDALAAAVAKDVINRVVQELIDAHAS